MADPFLDTLGVKDPTAAPAPAAKGATYDPYDLAVRLTMLEEKDPAARKWVAGVMANRAKGAKGDLLGELTKPGAFEPWASKQAELAAIDPASDDYKATAAAVLPILQGKAPDPTGGATQFYAPDAQAALAAQDGRPTKASFDDGKGVKVGDTLFFGGNGQAPDPFLSTLGVDPDAAPAAAPDPDTSFISFTGLPGVKGTKEQNALAKAMVQGGAWKEDAPEGSPMRPRFLQPGAKLDEVPAGSYYVGADGKMARMPGGDKDSSFGAGLGQGAGDVITTLSHLMPGSDDSTIKNRLIADQAIYGAQYGGDAKSGLGRFTGQALTSLPFLGGAEVGAAPLLARMGPIGEVLAGEGGSNMAPGMARLLTRGGSLATKGALEGAGAAGLVSSSSDEPLGDQLAAGAVGGALLGPAVPAAVGAGRWATRTVRDMAEPLSEAGRSRIADRIITSFGEGGNMEPDATVHIPGSVPTLAQATGNPGIASLERTVRLSRTHQFDAVDRAAAEARSAALDAQRGDEHTVADLVATRKPVVDAARARVFASTTPTDPAPVVSAIDAALASPEAHMESVRKPLEALRDKLVSPPPDMSPAEQAAFSQRVAATFDGKDLTPDSMDAAKKALGATFEDLASKTNIRADDEMRHGFAAVVHDAGQVLEEGKAKPLQNLVDKILSTVDESGAISGESYKALIRHNGPLDLLSKSPDGAVRHYAGQIRETLDDAFERTMASDFPGDKIPLAPKPYDPNAPTGAAADKAAPGGTPAPQLDLTDKALNLIRDRKTAPTGRGPSLVDMLISKGGVRDDGGELAAMDLKEYGKRGGLLQRGKGKTLNEAIELAHDLGYIGTPGSDVRPTPDEFRAALKKDMDGERIYAQPPTGSQEVNAHADELEEMLHEIGLDPATMPNGRIKQRLAEYFGTGAEPGAAPAAAAEGPRVDPNAPAPPAPGAVSPSPEVAALREARLKYKNMKTVEGLLPNSGVDNLVKPGQVLSAARRKFASSAYKGAGPLGDVAEAAVRAQETRPPVVQNDPGQIHGMRDSLSTAIGKLEADGSDESARAADRLKEVRAHMDAAIEKGAPGYGSYLHLAERSNEPVEAVRFLQSLKLTDKNEAPTLARVANALDRIHQMRNAPGKNPAKLVTQATLDQLESLKADLARADQLSRGRPLGSDTAQHIVTNNLAANMNVPLAVTGIGSALAGHPLVGAALGAGKLFYGAKNAQVLDALANRLIVPERIEPPVVRAAPPAITGPLKRFVSPALPATGGLVATRLLGK